MTGQPRRRWTLVIAVVVVVTIAGGGDARAAQKTNLMLSMEDGTRLSTDIFLPDSGGPAWPCILIRSAYPKRVMEGRGHRYAERGYACVIQDIRGMNQSEGERFIFYADGWRRLRDGAYTVRWMLTQPWCNGNIGTDGESALGATEVLLAPVAPELKCQCISVAPADFYHHMAYQGGVWRKNLAELWLSFLGLDPTIRFFKMHACYDTFWHFYNTEERAPDTTQPAIHIGGWYDIFLQGTIDSFLARQHHGGPGARGNQMLVMRMSTHRHDPCPDFKWPRNSRELDVGDLERAFQDYWLKGVQNGIMDKPAVHYYVIGDDTDPDAPGMEWRTAEDWPPYPIAGKNLYLAPEGALAQDAPAGENAMAFTFDPADPVRTFGGGNLFYSSGPYDQRRANRDRKDVLKFATPPLQEPLEIAGRVTVRLFVSTDAPDTDFTAKLVDIYPAGDEREILLLDGIQRVKFRAGFDKPAPLLTSQEEVAELSIDLWSTCCVFNKGHRIGLQISSSNYPRFEVNPNTGDDIPKRDKLRKALNTVRYGGARASSLILPVRAETAAGS